VFGLLHFCSKRRITNLGEGLIRFAKPAVDVLVHLSLVIVIVRQSAVDLGLYPIPLPSGPLPRPSLNLFGYPKGFGYRERSGTSIARCDAAPVEQIVGNLLDLLDPVM
jgi:hypothetical protein